MRSLRAAHKFGSACVLSCLIASGAISQVKTFTSKNNSTEQFRVDVDDEKALDGFQEVKRETHFDAEGSSRIYADYVGIVPEQSVSGIAAEMEALAKLLCMSDTESLFSESSIEEPQNGFRYQLDFSCHQNGETANAH